MIRRIALLLILVCAACLQVGRAQMPTGPEKILFDAVNKERVSQRLKALRWDAQLAEAARAHAKLMVAHNALSHQFPGEADLQTRLREAGAHFSMVAENVAEAPEVSLLHINWMNSAPHRENILDPQLTAIGIAVEMRGSQYFAVQDFSTAVASLNQEQQEKQVAALLAAKGIRNAGNSAAARKACSDAQATPEPRPRAITHFETPDLSQLPDEILAMIRKGRYTSASIGACEAGEKSNFTRFRIALLLY